MALTLYRPSLRAVGAMAVLISWAGSLAWLGERELGRDEASTLSSNAFLKLAPSGVWYAVTSGGVPVGNASVTLDTLSPGFRIVETVTLETPAGTGLMAATRRTATYLRPTLDLDSMRTRYGRVGREVEWILGVAGDTLTARSGTGATRTQGRVRFDKDLIPAVAFSYRLAMVGRLVTDRSRNYPMLEGWPTAGRTTSLDIGRDSMAVYADSTIFDSTKRASVAMHFDSSRALPVVVDGAATPYREWLDHRGTLVGMEMLFGVRWVRTDFDEAVTTFRRKLPESAAAIHGAFPVLAALGGLSGTPDTSGGYRFFLAQHRDDTRVDRTLLLALRGGRQDVHGDTIIVRADAWPQLRPRRDDAPVDPMIQSEAAAIVNFAKRFAGKPIEAGTLRQIIGAIRETVRMDTSVAAPDDALRSLANRRARPDGIARLFVAIARAAGYPARYVIGVAPRSGALYTHAWAEVWMGYGWYAVDPVLGQVPASTGLIRLAYGGSSYPEDMLPILANARITEIGNGVQP